MADKRISQLVERVDIANNDVVPIVASGATTTNKATISSIQTFMQENLDVGVTSVGITIGTSGTDVSVTGSPVTTSGNITINLPTASATNRGLLSAADWTTFNNKADAGNYVTLDTAQTITAQKTFTTSGSTDSVIISHGSGSGIALDVIKAGSGQAIRVQKTSGSGDAVTITGGLLSAEDATFSSDIIVNGVNVGKGGGSLTTNTRIGVASLSSNTTGNGNTANGAYALENNTTGSNNTAVGQESLENNIVGAFNTAIGFQALQDNTSSSNTAIGYLASSQNTSGSANFSGGARALENNTTGSVNTSIGFASLQTNTTGGGNVALGEDAGRYTSTGTGNTNGGDSVFIGRQTKPLGDSQTNQIVIGYQAIGNGSNTVTIGNSSITDNYFSGQVHSTSFEIAASGSANPTILRNTSGTTSSTTGSNVIGFNGVNNIFVSTQSRGGFILGFNNSVSNREYTLPDASGTIALTSNLSGYLPLTGGTLTGALNGTSLNFSGDVQGTRLIAAASGEGIILTPNSGGTTNRIESSGSLPLALVSAAAITLAAGGTTPQITLATNGETTFTQSGGSFLIDTNGHFISKQNLDLATAGGRFVGQSARGTMGLIQIDQVTTGADGGRITFLVSPSGSTTPVQAMRLASTGAATFSSSVECRKLYVSPAGGAGSGSDGIANIQTTSSTLGQTSELGLLIKNNGTSGYYSQIGFGYAESKVGAVIAGLITNSGGATSSALVFGTRSTTVGSDAPTERMRITSGGFLKASNTGSYWWPTGSYHTFENSVADWTCIVGNTNTSSPNGILISYQQAIPNNFSNNFLYAADQVAVRFLVYSNGGIANYQANNLNLSDERTKKDIEPLESYWDKFKAIEIVKFKYIDQTHDDFNIGVIAQQVEAVAPEFVDVDGWGKPELDEEGNEIVSEEEPLKSIYTADLHHATIKVLQEAMEKIEKLEIQIDSLKNQIK
jgi:hypothetical protein